MMAVMLIPTIWYAIKMERLEFPVTERAANSVSDTEMYRALLNPLSSSPSPCWGQHFELFINQWVDVLLQRQRQCHFDPAHHLRVGDWPRYGRSSREPILYHRYAPFSVVFTTIGLYMI